MLTDPVHEAEADAMSTDSSSASEAEIDDEALAQLQALEAAVQENASSYDAHVQVTPSCTGVHSICMNAQFVDCNRLEPDG